MEKKNCNFTILTGRVSDNVDVDTAAAADFRPQQSQDKKRPTFSSGCNNDVSISSDASTRLPVFRRIFISSHRNTTLEMLLLSTREGKRI